MISAYGAEPSKQPGQRTSAEVPPRYRVGRHLGRTIYRVVGDGPSERDELIGIMDTSEDGRLVVEALNARDRVLAGQRTSAEVLGKDHLAAHHPLQDPPPGWGES